MKHILILLAILSFISCENNVEEETITTNECNPEISFSEVIKPIIDNNCVQCHHGNRFPDLRMYPSINENKIIIKDEIQSRRMPIGNSLSQTDIDAVICWIESGALNN
ncbi:MAG TPA: cytochrome c [Flavobacteriia bacterium]|nr:cytochrome c [Flavobacteriia bacterium]